MYHTSSWPKYSHHSKRIHHQQQQNKPSTTPECSCYLAVIVLYFWIYNVFLYLTWYFCNHIVLMKLCSIQNSVTSKPIGIYLLPVKRNLVWYSLMKLCFSQCHTFQHCSDTFKLNKHTKCLNFTKTFN